MNKLTASPARKPIQLKSLDEKAKEETQAVTLDLGFIPDPTKVYIFETLKKSEQPRNENLGSTTKGFDPIEKRYREMRYFPTAPSIFAEEQHESYDDMQPPPLGFYRNQLTASGEDIRLIEYLTNHPLYEHSPFRVMNKPALFTLADKDVLEEIKAKKHAVELRALEVIKESSIDDIKPIARTIFGITETSDTAIVNTLNDLVKKPKSANDKQSNAEKFLDNVGNPKLSREYAIQSAVDLGIIAIDTNKMRVTFVEGNIHILNLSTKNPIKELVDYSFTQDGTIWYSALRKKV